MLPPFSISQWLLAVLGALCIGVSKSGFSGLGLVTVIVMAGLFPPRESTGVLLPLLIAGDIGAVLVFRKHAHWPQIWRMLPSTVAGIFAGYAVMDRIPDAKFGPVIGWIVLAMILLQTSRRLRPALFDHVPHTRAFAWSMGGASGVATMLANAAGPVMALYFLSIRLPKLVFVGTGAWFFLLVNLFKVPFSAHLGLIHGSSLLFNLALLPAVAAGILLGRWLIALVPQTTFELCLLILATLASLRLIGLF